MSVTGFRRRRATSMAIVLAWPAGLLAQPEDKSNSPLNVIDGPQLVQALRGLELARTHKPALILLDINLPDMDGYAVMQCLREHEATRAIPVLAISANAMPKDIERSKAAGFGAYLTKPIDVAELLRTVSELLAARPQA